MKRMKTTKSPQSLSIGDITQMMPEERGKFGIFSQFGNLLSIYWSFTVALGNFWILFSVLFSAATSGKPQGVALAIELAVEAILFLEVLARLILKKYFPRTYNSLRLTHKGPRDSYLLLIFLLIISFPGTVAWYLIDPDGKSGDLAYIMAYIMLLKLLRAYELMRFHMTLQEMLFFKEVRWIIFMKLVENVVLIFWIAHVLACIWMIAQRGYEGTIPMSFLQTNLFF